ncbi:MAG: DegT/DnrJ/EryC1/StrS family aminotransferase [Acidobacteriaceae bacterium]
MPETRSQLCNVAPSIVDNQSGPIPMLDFSRQYSVIRDEVLAAIEQVCSSQKFILGEEVVRFEVDAAGRCGAQFGIGCASGTDALWLAMAAANIGPGDAVITTPFSFFATVSSILRCGAKPLLADIDPATYNLDPAAVERILQSSAGKQVKAVLPVHLYGQCADWDAFTALKEKYGFHLIEDAAQAFGATWDGIPAGALGDLAAFSFYPTKNLSAYGDAGLVTTQDETLAERARMLRAHGMRRRYYHDEVGWNSRLDSLQAAILLVKLRYIAQWNAQRQQHAAYYDQLFREAGLAAENIADGVVLPFTHAKASHVFHQYVIRVPRRDALKAYLTQQRVGSEIYYPLSLHQQESLSSLGYKTGDFPESERAAAEVLALPMYPELRKEEQHRVVEACCGFYQ